MARPFAPTPVFSGADAIRFWSYIDKKAPNDCWEWNGVRDRRSGYGRFQLRYIRYGAHRVAFAIANNLDPGPDRMVCHSCDNPPCCNPAHLWLGTALDNNRDAASKGRQPNGEAANAAKLTLEQVNAILVDRRPQRAIAHTYGVTQSCIMQIHTGRKWKHLGRRRAAGAAIRAENYKAATKHGERSPRAKLTDAEVAAIRSDPRSNAVVARAYGVSKATIGHIRTGRVWKHSYTGGGRNAQPRE